MVRLASAKGVKIATTVVAAQPLTDSEWKTVEAKVKKLKDPAEIVQFDAKFDIICGHVPTSRPPEKKKIKGRDVWSLILIRPDERWASFLTEKDDVAQAVDGHAGCFMVVIGKLKPRVVKNDKDEDVEYLNINNFRDLMIYENEDDEDDDVDV